MPLIALSKSDSLPEADAAFSFVRCPFCAASTSAFMKSLLLGLSPRPIKSTISEILDSRI